MKFTKIKPYGDDAYTCWISGIYKIVSYRKGEYLAFYIPDRYPNWGDYVQPPPDNSQHGKCWKSLGSARAACKQHAASHVPSVYTVKRAEAIKKALLEQAHTYLVAA